jgi:hypothetical protein
VQQHLFNAKEKFIIQAPSAVPSAHFKKKNIRLRFGVQVKFKKKFKFSKRKKVCEKNYLAVWIIGLTGPKFWIIQ